MGTVSMVSVVQHGRCDEGNVRIREFALGRHSIIKRLLWVSKATHCLKGPTDISLNLRGTLA